MTPESPLFPSYEAQLDEQVAELDFQRRTVAALDTIDGYDALTQDGRLMLDARRIGHLVGISGVIDGTQIGKSIYQTANYGNTDERPTTVYMSPPFDEMTRGDVPCVTRVGKLSPPGYTSYHVYRVVVLPSEQTTLPDARGCYVAQNTEDKAITMFRVVADTSARSAVPGRTWTPRIELINGSDRLPVLDELEKAAAAVKAVPRSPRQTRW